MSHAPDRRPITRANRRDGRNPKAVLAPKETTNGGFVRVLDWVDRIRIIQPIQERMTAHTGRPRTQNWRTFFVLAALSAYIDGKVMLTKMNAIAAGLSPSQRWYLGITTPVTYPQLERMLNDLVLALRNDFDVNIETGEVKCDPLTAKPVIRPRLDMEMDELLTRIVTAAIPPHIHPTPGAAIDSTDFETMSKRMSWANDDPDITGDHLPPNPKGPRAKIGRAHV